MATPPVLAAPESWQTLAFLSDVHLHPSDTSTCQAWQAALQSGDWDALFILGDLFEVWVGDDVLDDPDQGAFWQTCARSLRAASNRAPVFFLPGNRDFLVGPRLLAAAGMTLLADPTVLQWGEQRWVLSHGDALCLSDAPYQAFRAEVRGANWQTQFLAQTLDVRLAMARRMRDASEQRKASALAWSDVDALAANQLLEDCHASMLMHGHTHMPATHALSEGRLRHVLTDWDATGNPPRGDVLRIQKGEPIVPPPLDRK